MREIPECLNRRYQALDELVKELSMSSEPASAEDYTSDPTSDAGVKLMCDFWNILKEDPDCNLTQAVRQRMGLNAKVSKVFHPQRVTCYMATSQDNQQNNNSKHSCKGKSEKPPDNNSPGRTCCSSKSNSPRASQKNSDTLPLSKVLCNLKEAVSFDKKCNIRIGELLMAEKQLQDQIQHLEHREKEGVQMLKQADCMWSCMEEAYKKKVQESQERANALLKQMKEVEDSNTKWRKNKKDLEFQCDNINKCYFEITEKMNEKKNDVKCIKTEIENLKKRIESNKKDTDAVKKSFCNKKSASDAKIAGISAEITRIKKLIDAEKYHKNEKEDEGNTYVQEARSDLQKICRVLLQKKLENEDLRAEKEAVMQEIEILRQSREQCKDKCKKKQQDIISEIAKIDGEIANFKVRCIKCHQCTDTSDARKFCTDCPRCAEERECLYEDGHCKLDEGAECVCMTTKQRFLDNVFDNMYTVLERQAKTCPGKAVAQAVLDCLKRSRNGKLNEETRKILQDFVLTTVKKNLNLTIIGGAVKTRCEMDPETYKQLMLCLKQVKTVKTPKLDKGTDSKKDACRRWGGTSECNCPKGPKGCICTKKAPPPPDDPEPCPPEVDKEDAAEVTVCPHKDSVPCGADCGMHAVPSVGTEVAAWRPAPCDEKHCTFSKNMRAAQCVLGPDSLSSVSKLNGQVAAAPYIPELPELDDQIQCKCGPAVTKPCLCRRELKSHPRERIIEEVMGRYNDVTPIEKVTMDESKSADSNMGCSKKRCTCSNFPIKNLAKLKTSANKTTPLCACASSYLLSQEDSCHRKKLYQKKHLYICRKSNDFCVPYDDDFYKIFPGYTFECSKKMVIGVKDGAKIAILTCPKIGGFKFVGGKKSVKRVSSKSVANVNTSSCVRVSEESKEKNNNIQKSGINLCGRTVCDTVKELIKDIVVSDTSKAESTSLPPEYEWITIGSLLKEISLLTRSSNASNITIDETEVRNEFLSDSESGSKVHKKMSSSTYNVLTKRPTIKNSSVINFLFWSGSYKESPQPSRENSRNLLPETVKVV